MAYIRRDGQHSILVAGNYGPEPRTLKLESGAKAVLLSNLGREDAVFAAAKQGGVTLASCESVVILL